ncbi:predicted protein [Plenodomus lingam JN3]|uniref:Predicted protein n=1 Tax=Leptosphaeria maculans (strain JN3 / isolate v23.1.3 / race Av1-4-5-6-7-8) TaxID=985895 RepID=E4ZZT9_LEPMJ|nr:predicted protein [Plenodomus lingam JN3]CBX96799.1 predicted protein [Plenodomus lingam JN3]
MLSLTLALTAFMATTSALPASNAPAYDHPSDGFHLIIKSSNLSFDGSYNAVNAGGSLIYVLQMMGGQQVPSAMHFSDRKGTNTQEMMFQPGEGDGSAQISFDESGGMWKDGSAEKWYMCETTSGYPMNLLVWVNGDAPTPQEPACQKVKVQRIWA